MNFSFDEYANVNSPVHRWDVRAKIIGLLVLMFAFASVEDLRLVPVILTITVLFYSLSQLPLEFLLRRLTYPGFFLVGVVGLLPFLSGNTIIWQGGIITIRQEGCLAVLLIASRFLAIFTLGLVLLGTSSFLTLIKGLRSLGLSPILTDIMLISYRYLFELGHQFQKMQRATQLRGFQPRNISRRNLQIYAALTGSLLIRSYQQSQQVYKAMQLRGYGAPTQLRTPKKVTLDGYSAIALLLTLLIASSLIGFELFL
ncbi:cobalt ECF transporter T component CbiQ [Planktothrix mougeotii]|uniref:Cobalt ECF transporter T component CbiQ n=1 Tax=Planktothrix mougeotii LEGE 06226 TaxID=1828728 RepID=A0ABR9UHX1_9CYAN|nr:cobalt ECF transporter T component CbiQ [Planktothrix mougeotii]MBE9146052.1 cobalt ECF transporter T component CbiQ [Planktothrix mougeotii LEGE 06226]